MISYFSLAKQNKSIKKEILKSISSIVDSGDFCNGFYVRDFENRLIDYLNISNAVGVSSGSSALIVSLKALNLRSEDEIIIPTNTFFATAAAVAHINCKVVFVDCDVNTANIDIEDLERKITKNTKCIIGVHLYGNPFDIYKVIEICKKYNIKLIEDCAQSFGSLYDNKMVGTFGICGCFSFYPSKNIGAFGEAGAVVTNDTDIATNIKALCNHGSFNKYFHDYMGFNMKMDCIQAAILSTKMKYIDEWNDKRRHIVNTYLSEIKNPNISFIKTLNNTKSVNHLFVVIVKDRKNFMEYMSNKGIETAIHYPIPCHLQKAFSYLCYKIGDFPQAEYLSSHIVSLPLYPELRSDELYEIVETINRYNL